MSKRKRTSFFESTEEDAVQQKTTKPGEYVLLKPIVNRGKECSTGDIVELSDLQAERLKRSGHI